MNPGGPVGNKTVLIHSLFDEDIMYISPREHNQLIRDLKRYSVELVFMAIIAWIVMLVPMKKKHPNTPCCAIFVVIMSILFHAWNGIRMETFHIDEQRMKEEYDELVSNIG